MAKKSGNKKGMGVTCGNQVTMTLREETCGKKEMKGGSKNVKSMLKLEHLQNLALWATGEASIPSLGAFFGQQLATCREALGIAPDTSLFTCQRCESVLQPGYNCTIRIEKNKAKTRRKKSKIPTQNNVVYTCNFCSHRNLMRGTHKGYVKELHPPNIASEVTKPTPEKHKMSETQDSNIDEKPKVIITSPEIVNNPETPVVKTLTLLEAKRGKRNRPGSKKKGENQSRSAVIDVDKSEVVSSKRRRKSWTSLREIAESSEHGNTHISNLAIPFCI